MDAKLVRCTGPERQALIEQVMQAEKAIFHALQANAGSVWSQLDLTMSQLKALHFIAHDGPLPVGGLGHALGIGKPAASLLVNRLVRQGLVTRAEDPLDRRRTLVALSGQGQELVEQLQGSRERLAQWLGGLGDADLADLARALRALAAAASLDLPPCDCGALPPAEEPDPDTVP